jgi:hypothetical protein
MNARALILQRLRTAMPNNHLPRMAVPPSSAVAPEGHEACVTRFVTEAKALGIECYVEGDTAAVHERLRTLVSGARVLSWNPEHFRTTLLSRSVRPSSAVLHGRSRRRRKSA